MGPVSFKNCFVCAQYMGPFKNDLSVQVSFTERTVHEIFEEFSNQKLEDEVITNAGICQNCFIKFNEYDEYVNLARGIQAEILELYENSLNVEESKSVIKEENETEYDVIEVMLANDNDLGCHEIFQRPKRKFKTQKPAVEKRTYIRKKNLDEGLMVFEVDGVKIYKCDICNKLCKDRYKLKTHREIHTTERKICCVVCGALFKTLTCLYSHKKIHKERVYHQCDHCAMRYIQKTQLRKHMDAIHLQRKDFVCNICGKSYSRDTTLSKHMFVHKDEKDIACQVCGFRTHTKPKMERHMKSHTGERKYSCNICGKMFLYSYNVTAHIKHVHQKEKRKVDEQKLSCKFCGKRFQKIWKVKEHEQTVHQVEEEVEVIETTVDNLLQIQT